MFLQAWVLHVNNFEGNIIYDQAVSYPSAAFNGVTVGAYNAGAYTSGSGSLTYLIGKVFSDVKNPSRVKIYGSNDYGFSSSYASTTVTLQPTA